jgi:predicted hotdog family 3-hydroxylacyl-ACP dehydratase
MTSSLPNCSPGLPCPVIELVPHRAPMLLLEHLEQYSPETGTAIGRVGADHPFLHDDGRLNPASFIEYLAQAAAAHEGFRRRLKDRNLPGGFLVGVHDFVIEGSAAVGDKIEVVACRGLQFDAFRIVTGIVLVEGRQVASGELRLLISEDPSLFEHSEARAVLPPPAEGSQFPLAPARRQALDRAASSAEYLLDGSLSAFHGHFPGEPILPAVAAVAIAVETVKTMADRPLELRVIKSAKFRAPVRPGAIVTIRCEPKSSGDTPLWRVRLESSGAVAADMKLEFRSDGIQEPARSTK